VKTWAWTSRDLCTYVICQQDLNHTLAYTQQRPELEPRFTMLVARSAGAAFRVMFNIN
jgi:hypothetical protein